MRKFFTAILALALLAGCAGGNGEKITQFSTIDALLAGVYDGSFTCRRVARNGNVGLGTFDRLDGEMVVVDGIVYQVPSNGTVRRAPGSLTTPFACVAKFRPSHTNRTTEALSYPALQQTLDRLCPDPNSIYAIRIRGEFPIMKARSVAAQKKPYRELVEVVGGQSIFNLGPARGTLVGFRFPKSFRGVNVPGYHLHFLSADRKTGGHVLDLTIAPGALIEASDGRRFEMFLPGPEGGFSRAALDRDRSAELHKVEQ